MNISLHWTPWNPVPDPAAEHNRPAPGIFDAVTVRTPMVAKPPLRPLVDTFSANDQDYLRKAWEAGILDIHRPKEIREKLDAQFGGSDQYVSQWMIKAVEAHLRTTDDTIDGICDATRRGRTGATRALRALKDGGLVVNIVARRGQFAVYRWVGK